MKNKKAIQNTLYYIETTKFPLLNLLLILVQIAITVPALVWLIFGVDKVELIYAFSIISTLLLVIMWYLRRLIVKLKFKSSVNKHASMITKCFNRIIPPTKLFQFLAYIEMSNKNGTKNSDNSEFGNFEIDSFKAFALLILHQTVCEENLYEKSKNLFKAIFLILLGFVLLFLFVSVLIFDTGDQIMYNRIALAIFIVVFSSSIIETFILLEITAKRLTEIKNKLIETIANSDLPDGSFKILIVNAFGNYTNALLHAPEIYNWFFRIHKNKIESDWEKITHRLGCNLE